MMTTTLAPNFSIEFRKALDRYRINQEEFAPAILDLAELAAQGRAAFPSDQDFSHWLVANDLDDLGKDDRAALINLGQHLDMTRVVLETTNRRSLRYIWLEEVQPRVRYVANPTPAESAEPEPAKSAVSEPESLEVEPAFVPPSGLAEPAAPPIDRPRVDLSRSPLRAFPHADLVVTSHVHKSTRTFIASLKTRRGFTALWSLMVDAIKQGAFGPPAHIVVTTPNLRLVLPWAEHGYAQRYNLLRPDHCHQVRDLVLPAVVAHPEIRETPARLAKLVQENYDGRQQQRANETRRAMAVVTGETPVICYGHTLWPDPPGAWTYQELLPAAWFVAFLLKQYPPDWSAQSRTIQTHALLKWIAPAHGSGWANAVRTIVTCYQQNPIGPCEVPPPPPGYALS